MSLGVTAGLTAVAIQTAADGLTINFVAPGGMAIAGPLLSAGLWYHVAMTLAPAPGGTLVVGYLNGKQVASTLYATALANYTEITVGGGAASGGAACLFAETCAWARALGPVEIAHHYAYRMPNRKGLIAYGKFDGLNSGDAYLDASGNPVVTWVIHRTVTQGSLPPPTRPMYQPRA